jgi:signal transduction histidine kinase
MMKTSNMPSINLLAAAASLTLLGVAVTTVLTIDTLLGRWLALALLAAIGGLTSRLPQDDEDSQPVKIVLILAVQSALLLALLLLFPEAESLSIVFYILSVEAMLYFPVRTGLVWLAGYGLAALIFEIGLYGFSESLSSLATFAGGLILFGLVSAALRSARQAQLRSEKLLVELRAANRQLQEYADQVETLSVHAERNRLAREMHDTIGHRLTVAAVQLEAARKLVLSDVEQAAGLLVTTQQQVREALTELRQTVSRLREPLETDLLLSHALQHLADSFRLSGEITIHMDLPREELQLPETHRLALYRAAQEGLTNIQRHSAATQAWLRLERLPAGVQLVIEDNGRGLRPGFALDRPALPVSGSFGLRGLNERMCQLGGRMEIDGRSGGGTRLCLSLPFTDSKAQPAGQSAAAQPGAVRE